MRSKQCAAWVILALFVAVGAESDGILDTFKHALGLGSDDNPLESNKPICDVCRCTDSEPFLVDCSGLGLNQLLPSSSWSSLASKQSIEVSYDDNKIAQVTAFDTLPIVKLSLRGNRVSSIQNAAFKNLEKLEYLDLSDNNLTQSALVREAFEGQYSSAEYEPLNVKTLKLAHNQIHSINKNAFDHLPFLEHLQLDHNPMEVIDHQTSIALTTLRKIKTLNLAETGIINIPEGFLHALPELTTLIVNGNRFKTMPVELQRAAKLEYLNLDNNLIKEIKDDSLKGLSNLKELNISSMPRLELIGRDSFSSLSSLEVLRCSFNPRLEKIHSRAFGKAEEPPASLREFYFRANAIESLPPTLLPWESLSVVDIRENPLDCDCSSLWIRRKIIRNVITANPELAEGITCNAPEEYQGSPIQSVSLVCDSENGTMVYEDDFPEDVIRPLTETENLNTTLTIIAIVGTVLFVGGVILVGYLGLRKRNMTLRKVYESSRRKVRYVPTRVEDPERQQPAGSMEERPQEDEICHEVS